MFSLIILLVILTFNLFFFIFVWIALGFCIRKQVLSILVFKHFFNFNQFSNSWLYKQTSKFDEYFLFDLIFSEVWFLSHN